MRPVERLKVRSSRRGGTPVRWRLPARVAATAAAALGGFAAALIGFAPGPSRSAFALGHEAAGLGGYLVAAPSYTTEGTDSTRIAAFSFRLKRVTPRTTVHAGVARSTFADSCRIGRIRNGSATITCAYRHGDEPHIRDASLLTVVAAN